MRQQGANIHTHVLEQASDWFIHFHEGVATREDQGRFNEWLRRSPEHVQAYLQMTVLWEDAEVLQQRPNLDIEAAIARAVTTSNVQPLPGAGSSAAVVPSSGTSYVRGVGRRVALAASVILAVGSALIGWHAFHANPTYATGIGEQRSVQLDDGSTIELNSRSRVKVRYTEGRRNVNLIAGQAIFRVAKDAQRPFVVTTGATQVRAVGTQFDVNRKHSGTVVTVIEGRVAVLGGPVNDVGGITSSSSAASRPSVQPSANGQRTEVLLRAGEQMIVTATAASVPALANLDAATAWKQRRLVFKDTPLRDVVEEFNRYNKRQLLIQDAQLDGFHISGVFPSTDSNRIVELLRHRFDVSVRVEGNNVRISRSVDEQRNAAR